MNTDDPLKGYLEKVTGRPAALRRLEPGLLKGLPGFLATPHRFQEWNWLDQKLVLVRGLSAEAAPSPAELQLQGKILADHFRCPVVYVLPALDAYRRNRLVHLGISFIVPGLQFFVPPFASFSERFRSTAPSDQLPAAAQVAVLYQLLRRPPEGSLLNQWAAWLGYSAMTMTKVRNELGQRGLCEVAAGAKPRGLHFIHQGRALWVAARPALRSPVHSTCWARLAQPAPTLQRAGLTALSSLSMLEDDVLPTFACRDAEWKRIVQARRAHAVHQDEATARIECWRYDPALLGEKGLVDRLSLHLSLSASPDERVRLAADELLEKLPW